MYSNAMLFIKFSLAFINFAVSKTQKNIKYEKNSFITYSCNFVL